jgi:hypothetical protein
MKLSVSCSDSFVLFVSFEVKDDRLCRLLKRVLMAKRCYGMLGGTRYLIRRPFRKLCTDECAWSTRRFACRGTREFAGFEPNEFAGAELASSGFGHIDLDHSAGGGAAGAI